MFAYEFNADMLMKKVLSCLLLWSTVLFLSCLKKDFDAPPDTSSYDPQLPVTLSIMELQQGEQGIAIESDDVIAGVVVMDDRSGNIYKKVIVQDNTGGIELLIDQNNLYNDYPIGRKIYVRLKGLFLGNNGQSIQLGHTPNELGTVSPIPFTVASQYIVKANFPEFYQIDTLTIGQLLDPDQAKQYVNTIVALKDVEFAIEDVGVPYAQPSNIASATSLTIQDCQGAGIPLRTSGYANFQPVLTPAGKGTMLALYSRYNNTAQLCIRDTNDIWFRQPRCETDGLLPVRAVSVDSIKSLFKGAEIILEDYLIRGVVISDKDGGNISGGIVVLQGSSDDGGIALYYGGQPQYAVGDSLEIDISGCTLKLFNSKLEIDGVSVNKTSQLASGRSIKPQLVTIEELKNNRRKYESTLVTVLNVNWEGDYLTYIGNSGNLVFNDGTGTIRHYTAAGAVFKHDPLPKAPLNITGFIEMYNGEMQIRIRNPHSPLWDVN